MLCSGKDNEAFVNKVKHKRQKQNSCQQLPSLFCIVVVAAAAATAVAAIVSACCQVPLLALNYVLCWKCRV